jgi:hypothetical protein
MDFSKNIWTHICNFIPYNEWKTIFLISKNANKGINDYIMLLKVSKLNTWSSDVPIYLHNWKCNHYPKGVCIENTPYVKAFEQPETCKFVHKMWEIEIDKNYLDWNDFDNDGLKNKVNLNFILGN